MTNEAKTVEEFQRAAVDASHIKPVVAVLWGDNCAPCRTLKPKIAELSDKHKFPVVWVKATQHREIAVKLGVRSVPTVIVYNRGKEVLRFAGDLPADELKTTLLKVGAFQLAIW